MWYEKVIRQLSQEKEYTRQQIYEALVKEKPKLTFNSFKWIISEMADNGTIYRKQRGKYVLRSSIINKSIYKPSISERLLEISEKIKTEFPSVNFVCFESVLLNEFLNHLIGRNTFFIFVEKDTIDFVFRYLQEKAEWNVLLNPTKKEWDAYCIYNNIVMLNLISEAPKSTDRHHSMSIEQLLVDIVAEKSFKNLYSQSELQKIYNLADKSYLIDYGRLLRYARRRNKANEVKKYIGEHADAYTR